eukprot:5802734-Pyramimonas_sp.AAC.1
MPVKHRTCLLHTTDQARPIKREKWVVCWRQWATHQLAADHWHECEPRAHAGEHDGDPRCPQRRHLRQAQLGPCVPLTFSLGIGRAGFRATVGVCYHETSVCATLVDVVSYSLTGRPLRLEL